MYSNWKFNQVNDRLVSYRQCKQDIFSKLSLEKSIKFPEFLIIKKGCPRDTKLLGLLEM